MRSHSIKILPLFFLFLCLEGLSGNLQAKSNDDNHLNIEDLLIQTLFDISEGNLNEALNNIDDVIEKEPNFKLAHLIKGDIYLAQAKGLERFGGSTNYSSEEVSELREEARRRIKSHLETNYLSPNSEHRLTLSNKIDNLVFIDTSGSRLIVFKNNGREIIKLMDAYISIGKNGSGKQFEGDKKTPIGVYTLGNKIKQKLSDFYGDGAFPINYPNIYDKLQNKTGHGIWIHGTPKNTYSRAPQSSDGCVVLANDDLKRLETILKSNKTKVIISEESYQSYLEKNLEDSHDNFIKTLDEWKNSWESKFIANYLAFYDGDAKNNGRHYSDWTNDKFEIFRNTKDISVEIENISIIDYPDDKDTIRYVEFDQHYQSNLLINSSHKMQIWKKFNNDWKIINETSI